MQWGKFHDHLEPISNHFSHGDSTYNKKTIHIKCSGYFFFLLFTVTNIMIQNSLSNSSPFSVITVSFKQYFHGKLGIMKRIRMYIQKKLQFLLQQTKMKASTNESNIETATFTATANPHPNLPERHAGGLTVYEKNILQHCRISTNYIGKTLHTR
jgi:hypothetical protein